MRPRGGHASRVSRHHRGQVRTAEAATVHSLVLSFGYNTDQQQGSGDGTFPANQGHGVFLATVNVIGMRPVRQSYSGGTGF